MISLKITCPNDLLEIGVVVAINILIAPASNQFQNEINNIIKNLLASPPLPSDNLKKNVRDLLRKGGYKPAGRGKPACEYITKSAANGNFPFINNVVDCCNLLSLETGLPMSLLDLDKIGDNLEIRYGKPDEKYVFNASGQEISLAGLISVCGISRNEKSEPFGNPVKDSMKAKTTQNSQNVIGIVYSPQDVITHFKLEQIMKRFAQLLINQGNAEKCSQYFATYLPN